MRRVFTQTKRALKREREREREGERRNAKTVLSASYKKSGCDIRGPKHCGPELKRTPMEMYHEFR